MIFHTRCIPSFNSIAYSPLTFLQHMYIICHWVISNLTYNKSLDRIFLFQDACCKYPKICDGGNNTSKNESINSHDPFTLLDTYDGFPVANNQQNKSTETIEDCHQWSSDSNKLCFECYACKKGYLFKQDQNWATALSICVINSVVLLSFSCYFYSKNFEEPGGENSKSNKVHPANV